MLAQKNNTNLTRVLISFFTPKFNCLVAPKILVQLLGCYSLALIIAQILFWSNKSKLGGGWFFKEYSEWFEETHTAERTMRRRLDKLEQMGWIETKVKRVNGLNVKHIRPLLRNIYEDIYVRLNKDNPNALPCEIPQELQKIISGIVIPIDQNGRLEPAKMSDSSIYTDNYNQIITTNCESSSSFTFSETLDNKILNEKLFSDERTDEEFMQDVVDHVDKHSDQEYPRIVRAQGAVKLLQKLKKDNIVFYPKGKRPKDIPNPVKAIAVKSEFNPEELKLVGKYKAAMKYAEKYPEMLDIQIPCKQDQLRAVELIQRMKAKESQTCSSLGNNARKNSLTSVSSLVSHLNSSQQDS